MPSDHGKCRSCGAVMVALRARFDARVAVAGPDECWPWTARRDKYGYGLLDCVPPIVTTERPVRAHRLASFFSTGIVPSLDILHSCDNPWCCNPAHLREGTQADNMRDMDNRGRRRPSRRPGVLNHNAVLTAETVREIRSLYATGRHTQHELADRFSISRGCVCDVVRRKTYREVASA